MRRTIAATLLTAALLAPIAVSDGARAQSDTEATKNSSKEQNRLDADEDEPLPEIYYSDEVLPAQVLNTRNALLQAARSGDLEKLRPLIESFDPKPIVSFGDYDDPIAYWRDSSADGTGRDIMAEMIKVFSSGFSHINTGTAEDTYVWPYHFVYPLDKLTAEQEVELYLLVPAEYRKEMEDAGGYIGFRAGISPTGSLVFFVAGD
ncbi:MAG: hypothetical protein ACR2PM_06225 [Hyphomicrobiales bacterium]